MISLLEELLRRLRVRAAERGTSMAALIREALEDEAGPIAQTPVRRPKPKSIGMFASGRTDTAEGASDLRPEPHA